MIKSSSSKQVLSRELDRVDFRNTQRVHEHTTHVKLKYYMCYKVSGFLTESLHQTSLSLEFKVGLRHVDGPGKLVSLGLIVDFLYWYLIVLTPVCMKKKTMFRQYC